MGDPTCWARKNAISLNHRGRATFRGRFLPQNQRKIEFGLIRWAGPSLRVFTAIFLAYLHVLEVIQAVFPRIYVKWRNNACNNACFFGVFTCFGLIRWAGPSSRVFTAIFLAYLHVLEVIQAVFPRIYVKWRNNACNNLYVSKTRRYASSSGPSIFLDGRKSTQKICNVEYVVTSSML